MELRTLYGVLKRYGFWNIKVGAIEVSWFKIGQLLLYAGYNRGTKIVEWESLAVRKLGV